MEYTGIPVEASVASARALASLVRKRYRLETPLVCTFRHKGLNDTYLLRSGESEYYLRLYRCGWRTKSEIEAEVDMLDYLARRRQPVSRPVKRRDGSYLCRVAAPEGTRYFVVFTSAPGTITHPYTIGRSRQYGELVGEVHACLDRRPVDPRRFHLDLEHLVDRPLRFLKPFLEPQEGQFEYLRQLGDELKSGIDDLLPRTRPYYGCCHGDHHGYNAHVDEQGKLTLFDFDCYGYGWRAYDIAVFRWQMASQYGWTRSGQARATRRWKAFLEGYSKTRRLTEEELKATKLFVAIRQIWLMWVQVQGSETWGGGYVTPRYFGKSIAYIRGVVEHYRLP